MKFEARGTAGPPPPGGLPLLRRLGPIAPLTAYLELAATTLAGLVILALAQRVL